MDTIARTQNRQTASNAQNWLILAPGVNTIATAAKNKLQLAKLRQSRRRREAGAPSCRTKVTPEMSKISPPRKARAAIKAGRQTRRPNVIGSTINWKTGSVNTVKSPGKLGL